MLITTTKRALETKNGRPIPMLPARAMPLLKRTEYNGPARETPMVCSRVMRV